MEHAGTRSFVHVSQYCHGGDEPMDQFVEDQHLLLRSRRNRRSSVRVLPPDLQQSTGVSDLTVRDMRI